MYLYAFLWKHTKITMIFKIKHILILFFLIFQSFAKAQPDVRLFTEETPKGVAIYAENSEYCPTTVWVEYKLKNFKILGPEKTSFLIPAKSKKTLLAIIAIIDKYKPSTFGYSYSANFGDDQQTEYDRDFVYHLPFEKGNSFGLFQGYNGKFSHQNENSLDFTMPIGTPITAIRGGKVIKIVENNDQACLRKECAQYNNYVTIYHSDGTFANYAHLMKNGVLVNVGDEVNQGQIIAKSGNTGWSSGPHLHLAVYLQKMKSMDTLTTQFKTGDGTTTQFLSEQNFYSREY